MLKNLRITVVLSNIVRKPLALFQTQIANYGRTCTSVANVSTSTHVLFEEDYHTRKKSRQDVLKMISVEDKDTLTFEVLSSKWLSACIRQKKLVDVEPYRFIQSDVDEVVSPQNVAPAAVEESGNDNDNLVDVIVRIMESGPEVVPPSKNTWDEKDDSWLRCMALLRKGFFQMGVVLKYD